VTKLVDQYADVPDPTIIQTMDNCKELFLIHRGEAQIDKPDSRIAFPRFSPPGLSGYDSAMADRKILVVDDDKRLRELLQRYLGDNGFLVKTAENGEAMDKALARDMFDLIVLDLMLPGEDGLSICRRMRASDPDQAVIMLTAKGDEIDRIVGLEMGADDYLPKPFNPRELIARIQAVLRRRVAPIPGAPTGEERLIVFSDVEVDLATRTLKRNGETLPLTTGEFAVLKVLLEHPRQPLSRDRLMALARGREQGPFDRAIDVQVSRLRKLIEPDPATPRYLQTVWGFGYVFIPDGQAQAK
jgi:two-component system OmpR family response regulator/two-component system phosphate regulon response regulator OmpR